LRPGEHQMDIRRCFEILELDRDASPGELKQAYKDMVSVWHPDRFSSNPRLRKKAEEKLKQANLAYETLNSYLSLKQQERPGEEKGPEDENRPGDQTKGSVRKEAGYYDDKAQTEEGEKLESLVRVGTIGVLTLWSHLSSAFRRIFEEARTEIEREEVNHRPRRGGGNMRRSRDMRGKSRYRGRGAGRGGRHT
jgi:curved DNA-binding protein CbpA